MNINFYQTFKSRPYIIEKILLAKKKNANYKVIDIGGAVNGWSKDIIDFLVDKNVENSDTSLSIDICIDHEWDKLKKIVNDYGKFDYCICTHTLEDLYNPLTALKNISEIAKAGVITAPSAKTELSRIENSKWLGYIHHRWLFDKDESNSMLLVPKLNFLESMVSNDASIIDEEIIYEWEEQIDFKIFMNNYLGPNVKTVLIEYEKLLKNLDRLK